MKHLIVFVLVGFFFPQLGSAQLKLIKEIEGDMEYVGQEITENHIVKIDYDKKTICLFNEDFDLKTHIELTVPKNAQLHQAKILSDGKWGKNHETLFAVTYVRYKLDPEYEDPAKKYVHPIFQTKIVSTSGAVIANLAGCREVKLVKNPKGQYLFIAKFFDSDTETIITRIYSYNGK